MVQFQKPRKSVLERIHKTQQKDNNRSTDVHNIILQKVYLYLTLNTHMCKVYLYLTLNTHMCKVSSVKAHVKIDR